MACPDSVNMDNLDGGYSINRTLSDDPDEMMVIRGIPWAVRKAFKLAPSSAFTFTFRVDTAASVINLGIPGLGPIKPTTEIESLQWEWKEKDQPMAGKMKTRMRFSDVKDVNDPFLGAGWCEDKVLEVEEVKMDGEWEVVNIWGFRMIEGKKYFCRASRVKNKKGKVAEGISVHDFKPLAA